MQIKLMHKSCLLIPTLALAFASQTFSSHAASPETTPVAGGVTIALTESGYEFTPKIGTLIPLSTAGTSIAPIALPPQGFTASVELKNHTNGGIPCTIGFGQTFEFTVYNSKGTVVWNSLPLVLPQFMLLTSLPAGDTWSDSAFVPLFIKGKALPAGTYRLDVSLFGTPEFSATTTFVVHNVIAIN